MKLLLCGGYTQTLMSAVRSLGRKGHQIDVAVPVSQGKFRIARWFASKFIRQQFRIAHPLAQAVPFDEQLLQLVKAGGYDAVMPFDQRIAVRIAREKHILSQFTRVVSPDWSQFEIMHDKLKLHQLLGSHGFSVPRFYPYQTLAELLQSDLRFPVVLKPRRAAGSLGVRYAANRAELAAAYEEVSAFRSPCPEVEDFRQPLVQEYIPGKILDACFACRSGETRAALTELRSTTYPITGGYTVEAVTTHNPELIDYCGKMLAFLNYDGICDVEVKQDDRDGTFKLLEINPRIWGALELSLRAGIDFTEKACELAVTGDTPVQMNYRVGVKHWILQRELMAIQQDKEHRWQRIRGLARFFSRDIVTGIDFTDWKPELVELVTTLRLLTRKQNCMLPAGRSFTVEQCAQLAASSHHDASPLRKAG